MRIKLITTILFTCVLSACQPQATTENSKNNAASATNAAKAVASGDMASVKKNIQAALEKAYPEQKVQIKSVDAVEIISIVERNVISFIECGMDIVDSMQSSRPPPIQV